MTDYTTSDYVIRSEITKITEQSRQKGTSGKNLIQLPCLEQTVSSHGLRISSNGGATASLDSLFHAFHHPNSIFFFLL